MSKDRAIFLDIHYSYQDIYKDDGITEGWGEDPTMIIQQATRGQYSYFDHNWGYSTNPVYGRTYREQFILQHQSIQTFPVVMGYTWFESESWHTAQEHADAVLRAIKDGGYKGWMWDFETIGNVINGESVRKYKEAVDRVLQATGSSNFGFHYGNQTTLKMMLAAGLSPMWLHDRPLILAGGKYYNKPLTQKPDDDYHIWDENVWMYKKGQTSYMFMAWGEQINVEPNKLADEFDFGTKESASIDIGVINKTPAEVKKQFGVTLAPTIPPLSGGELPSTSPVLTPAINLDKLKTAQQLLQEFINDTEKGLSTMD